MLISRASEEPFVTVLAIGKKRSYNALDINGKKRRDALEISLTVTTIGREVVI